MLYVHDLGSSSSSVAGNHTRLAFVDEAAPEVLSDAFTIPNWGGLVLVGDPDAGAGLAYECGAVVSQLREMLGLDAVPGKGGMWRAGDVGLAPWERRVLLEARLHMYLGKTYDQLLSLLELLDTVSVLPVNPHVAGNISLVMDTLSELQIVLLGSGKSGTAAHEGEHGSEHVRVCEGRVEASVVLARRALHASTSAFFDPTMLPLLYFPQEFIYAVYFPFMMPLIMAMLSACKQQRQEIIES
jgi:phosphatidylinositol glycan class S